MSTDKESKRKSYGIRVPKINLGFMLNVEKGLEKLKNQRRKSVRTAYLFAVFLGMFGGHHFYLNRWFMGVVYLLTFGIFGIGWIIDLFRIRSLVEDQNDNDETYRDQKGLLDSYLAWFPLGFIGAHHFYHRNFSMGLLYLVTLGVYGIGWALDGFFMPTLMDHANSPGKFSTDLEILRTYLIAASPFGILGGHHYYSGRKHWGIAYTLTLGGCGIWWLFDLFRISAIVHRRKQWVNGKNKYKRYTDDVYLIWFLFGLLGGHHFYLKRYKTGLVYLFTLGCFGMGWVIDLVRLPWLVRDFNLDNFPEEEMYFQGDIMADLSDFDQKELQRIIRQARYTGENLCFENDDDVEEYDGKYFDLDRVISAIRESQHHEEQQNVEHVQLFENVNRVNDNNDNGTKDTCSQITTVAVISHGNDSCAQSNTEDKLSDGVNTPRTDKPSLPNGDKAVILNPKELQSLPVKMNRSQSIPVSMTNTEFMHNTVDAKIKEKEKRRKLSLSYSRQYDGNNDIQSVTSDTNNKDESDDVCRKEQNIDSSSEISDHRKRKMLIRSNTQVAGLSWTDAMHTESHGHMNGHGGARRVSLDSSSLPRITQIPIRSAKRKVSTSSAQSQTSSISEEDGIQMSLDFRKTNADGRKTNPAKREWSRIDNKRSLSENDACDNVQNSNSTPRSQSISDEIIKIVSSASLINVFEDIEEILAENDVKNNTEDEAGQSDTLRSVKDTGIGVHNVRSGDNKTVAKRSGSLPNRQTTKENVYEQSNESAKVLTDNLPFMEPSKIALSLRRSSTQTRMVNMPEKAGTKRRRSLLPKLTKSSSDTNMQTPVTFLQDPHS